MKKTRNEVVKMARSFVGLNEADGSYMKILNIYNSFDGTLPRGVKMKPTYAWCACTWSAIAIVLGYTDIMPIEISCGNLIKSAQRMGCWEERDNYVPKPGDAILYDWQDSGSGDNTGWPDHIGIVEEVRENAGYFIVIEGNFDDQVKRRNVNINGKFIRGFITPKYDEDDSYNPPETVERKTTDELAQEVIAGKWGRGQERRDRLTASGYDYQTVQNRVNQILNGPAATPNKETEKEAAVKEVRSTCYARSENKALRGSYVTTANLHCRNDAGKNKVSLCVIPKGSTVRCYGYYTEVNGTRWLLIQVTLDNVTYIGFSSEAYLAKK